MWWKWKEIVMVPVKITLQPLSLRPCRGCWLHCQVTKNSWLINFLVNGPSISCDTVWCKSWHKTQTSWWEQRKCQLELWEDTLGGSSPSSSVVPAGDVLPGATVVFGDHEGSHHQVKFIMAKLEEHRSSATSLGQQLSHFWIYLIWDNDYLYLCLVELGHNFIECPLVHSGGVMLSNYERINTTEFKSHSRKLS